LLDDLLVCSFGHGFNLGIVGRMAVANEVGFTYKQKIEIQLGESRNDLNRTLSAYERGGETEGA